MTTANKINNIFHLYYTEIFINYWKNPLIIKQRTQDHGTSFLKWSTITIHKALLEVGGSHVPVSILLLYMYSCISCFIVAISVSTHLCVICCLFYSLILIKLLFQGRVACGNFTLVRLHPLQFSVFVNLCTIMCRPTSKLFQTSLLWVHIFLLPIYCSQGMKYTFSLD